MKRGCERSGVKRIRVHDLRHSHVSLLINMGFTALAIADRMGHEATDITFRYAHMFPNVQDDMRPSWTTRGVGCDAMPELQEEAHDIEGVPHKPRGERAHRAAG